jgi:hypothetical protein
MTPAEKSAYDSYPDWMAQTLAICQALVNLPLEELLAANTRLTLTGARMSGGRVVETVDPVTLTRQRALLEKVIGFRDAIVTTEVPTAPAPAGGVPQDGG